MMIILYTARSIKKFEPVKKKEYFKEYCCDFSHLYMNDLTTKMMRYDSCSKLTSNLLTFILIIFYDILL